MYAFMLQKIAGPLSLADLIKQKAMLWHDKEQRLAPIRNSARKWGLHPAAYEEMNANNHASLEMDPSPVEPQIRPQLQLTPRLEPCRELSYAMPGTLTHRK